MAVHRLGLDNRFKVKKILRAVTPRNRLRVLIAATPQSGSTYLSVGLSQLLNAPLRSLAFQYGRREQEIDWVRLIANANENVVFTNQHLKMSSSTRDALEIMNLRMIVLVRDVFDSVVSLRDHMERAAELPMAFIEAAEFRGMPFVRQIDFIVDTIAPWYFSFCRFRLLCGWTPHAVAWKTSPYNAVLVGYA